MPIRDELQIYTWKNASLRELSQLIGGAKKAGRARDAILSFAFVYPDKTGKNVVRKVGETQNNLQNSETDMKTLAELKFETGDYLDVAILPAKEE